MTEEERKLALEKGIIPLGYPQIYNFDIDTIYNTITGNEADIEDKVSKLTKLVNDNETDIEAKMSTANSNISTLFSKKADKATTLAGYGITDAYTKTETDAKIEAAFAPGNVQMYAGSGVPTGWLLCDGSSVSSSNYPKLYAAIGTTYGGSGSSFNLPNFTDKVPWGSSSSGTVKTAGLPEILGKVSSIVRSDNTSDDTTGAFEPHNTTSEKLLTSAYMSYTEDGDRVGTTSTSGWVTKGTNFRASNYDKIYGASATVQPPALTIRFIIKY